MAHKHGRLVWLHHVTQLARRLPTPARPPAYLPACLPAVCHCQSRFSHPPFMLPPVHHSSSATTSMLISLLPALEAACGTSSMAQCHMPRSLAQMLCLWAHPRQSVHTLTHPFCCRSPVYFGRIGYGVHRSESPPLCPPLLLPAISRAVSSLACAPNAMRHPLETAVAPA